VLFEAEVGLDDALAALAFITMRDTIGAEDLVEIELPGGSLGDAQRPELAALEADLAAATLALHAARWTWAPSIALTGRYDIGRESLRAPDGRSWTLALTFAFDLYDPTRSPRIHAAEVAVSVASIESQRLQRELVEARDAAARRVQQADDRRALADRSAEVAEAAHALMRERFELGDATLLDMTEADGALAAARLDAALARIEADRSRIDLLVLDGAFDDDAPDMVTQ
jgi:outer membrane protein TolC